MIPISTPWLKQPQQPVSFKLAAKNQGLRHLIYGGEFAIGDNSWQGSSTPERITFSQGVARRFVKASSQALVSPSAIATTDLTLFIVARLSPDGLGANRALISAGNSIAFPTRYMLYYGGTNLIAAFQAGSTGSGQAYLGTPITNTTDFYVYIARFSGTSYRDLWLNGSLVATDTTPGVFAAPTTVAVGGYWLEGSLSSGYYFSGDVACAGFFNRAISDAEARSLSKTALSYTALLDRRSFYLPTPISSTLPTLSAARAKAGSITSTGWISQITAS